MFTTEQPFEQPGDSFFSGMITCLVPVDDPEETLADNFAFTLLREADEPENLSSPEIIRAIDALLKGNQT